MRNFVFTYLVVMVGLTASLEAKASTARASTIVNLGNHPRASTITVYFDRTSSETASLLMTSINISYANTSKQTNQLNVTPTSNYFSLLTGWFVMQQRGQELWIGLTLPQGENHGELTLSIPGMLPLNGDYSGKYELAYYPPNPMLSNLTTSSTSAQYAPMGSIKIEHPDWGDVSEDETTGWSKTQGGCYEPDLSGKETNKLILNRNPNALAEWLRDKLASFSGGLTVALIATLTLFGMRGEINNKHRYFSLGIILICLIVLFLMGGEFPPNLKIILFNGAKVIGFTVPFFLVAILPTHITEAIRLFFNEIRKVEGANHE